MVIDNVITTSQVVRGTRICTWVTSVLAVIGLIDLCIHCTAVFITLKNNVRQVLENMSPHKLDKCNIIKNIYI